MALLEIKDLEVHYKTRKGSAIAVDSINIAIEENETVGLIGESGCGKSTTARSILKIIKEPGEIVGGKIIFKGNDILTMPDSNFRSIRGNKLTIVRQEAQNALNPVMSIGSQIAEVILAHQNLNKKDAWEKAKEQLDIVGINHNRANSFPHELSGGMRQRGMIAIATACNPDFIVMDEPITGLDVIVQRQLLTLINDLRVRLNLTALFIAHDLSVVSETCDRVVVMYAGKIMEKADIVSLYKNPLHPYTQALISSYPSIRGEKKDLSSIPGSPPPLVDPPEGCRFHPRCKFAIDRCRIETPKMREIDGHSVACHIVKG